MSVKCECKVFKCNATLSQYTEARAGCVILATALLWVTEGMPLMLTALLPAVMFPLAGILDSKTVCSKYFSVSYRN